MKSAFYHRDIGSNKLLDFIKEPLYHPTPSLCDTRKLFEVRTTAAISCHGYYKHMWNRPVR